MEGAFHDLIEQMVAEVNRGPAIYRPSEFWVRLNDLHEAQLTDAGFESFKRAVNQSYYNWLLGVRTLRSARLLDGLFATLVRAFSQRGSANGPALSRSHA